MEEGELPDHRLTVPEVQYDPSLEWPGDSAGPSTNAALTNCNTPSTPTSSFRLLVHQSAVIPKSHTIAIFDGYSEVQIGRDAPSAAETTPRLRLKEMEVSKVHASVYWDKDRHKWAVVDMGSKHGTFHLSHRYATNWRSDPRGTRLSPPRVASIPFILEHGDTLSIGNTAFTVHIHEDGVPCASCSPSGGDEILLFDHLRSKKRKRADSALVMSHVPRIPATDPKRAMHLLKRNLLSRHEPTAPPPSSVSVSSPAAPYVDRSARRRALHSDTPDPPPARLRKSIPTPITTPPPLRPTPTTEPVSAPSAPLPSTNIGHKLLMKQGWQPGTALGASDSADTERGSVALIEPLDVSGNVKRTGLGMSVASPAPVPLAGRSDGAGWKEEAKFRRWASIGIDELRK
ncbi:hypothetical protein BXZ70DRAFT_1025278 [Cristinia sonorae]|uniref:Angiogenic factor with G patch and FHA domains 1 n=1 Tax=Cristinia sonorae TaxID=1940300 RepID=A0A8K0XPB3_9AGAR|nr:hypothetical protein BXZ70DRAFT_1025278 [Cristinia sonorae]